MRRQQEILLQNSMLKKGVRRFRRNAFFCSLMSFGLLRSLSVLLHKATLGPRTSQQKNVI
ncbi:Hypothetical protein HDN1F_15420 [gamma proteobacterium HdN1]|nr:Hypothetical protein HDN1F_15420 [gamma proteobacterium HdN1]